MRMLNQQSAEVLLTSQGVPPREAKKIMSGFDVSKPMYEHQFWDGDKLFQLVRLPSATDPLPSTGNWFGLTGMTSSGVAVNDGLSGRRLVEFRVAAPFTALEGTAARFVGSLHSGIGGPGGQTQVFVPRHLVASRLESVGPAERR